jgi:hypothetical protein
MASPARDGAELQEGGPPKTLVLEIHSEKPGTRMFVVQSEERLAYDRATRERSMEKTRAALDKLARRVARGQLKAPDKIGAAAARILSRHRGQRYFDWRFAGGAFRFFEHPDLDRERAFEGKYVIEAEESSLRAVEVDRTHEEPSELKWSSCTPEDAAAMQAFVRRASERLRAHVFVGALAFMLDRGLDTKREARSSRR